MVSLFAKQGTVAFPSSRRTLREQERGSHQTWPENKSAACCGGIQDSLGTMSEWDTLRLVLMEYLEVGLLNDAGESAWIVLQWTTMIPPQLI